MKLRTTLIAFIFPFFALAQNPITLKSAIDSTLKNNFDIQIASNNVEISKLNNNVGMAGGLPAVNINIVDNQTSSDVLQKLNSGAEIKKSAANGNALTSNITAGILLYNGSRVIATRQRLQSLQKQSELQLNLQIQNSIAAVMAKYYDIVRQSEYLKIIERSKDVSQTKLDIITDRRKVGMANDADYLQALIDLNTIVQSLKSQQLIVDETKTELLQLMSIKKFYAFQLKDSIVVDKSIELESILSYLQKNPQYLSSEQQIKINEQVVKEVSSLRYPSLRINTGLNFNRNQSSAGLTLMNQNVGPYAGISLQVPIYNGNTYKTQKKTAQVNVDNAKIQLESLFTALTADALKTFHAYQTSLEQISSQQNSVDLSAKLIQVVLQRFSVNQATILDVKAAQASFENSGYQLVNLSYAAKIAEIELKRLKYQLAN
ncbi:MAG: TolC family protein [Bacteroidia bacterium]|nr:TolC family protein [Bacteroidia bacterium]